MSTIKWHPFPTEKPKKKGRYLVTVIDHADDDSEPVVIIGRFRKKTGHFWAQMDDDVLAWAKLPEPYKKEKENERS